MKDVIKNCENMIIQVQDLLKQNQEWILRYAKYAKNTYLKNMNLSICNNIEAAYKILIEKTA